MLAFFKCKNTKYSGQKDKPAFYGHYKNVQTNVKCSRFECPHCKEVPINDIQTKQKHAMSYFM